jgi:hypothetical protein
MEDVVKLPELGTFGSCYFLSEQHSGLFLTDIKEQSGLDPFD